MSGLRTTLHLASVLVACQLLVLGTPTSAKGCCPTVTVTLSDPPAAIKTCETFTFTATGTPSGGTYFWSASGGELEPPNPTGASATFRASSTGTYASVSVTYTYICTKDPENPRPISKSDSKSFTVVGVLPPTPSRVQIFPGQTAEFTTRSDPEGYSFMLENMTATGPIEPVGTPGQTSITVKGTGVGLGKVKAKCGCDEKTAKAVVVDLGIEASQPQTYASFSFPQTCEGAGGADPYTDQLGQSLGNLYSRAQAVKNIIDQNGGNVPTEGSQYYEQYMTAVTQMMAAKDTLTQTCNTISTASVTFSPLEATANPLTGYCDFVVRGLPVGEASIAFTVSTQVAAWQSTDSFPPGLGTVAPGSGTAGTVPMTFTCTGSYGTAEITVTSTDPPGISKTVNITVPTGFVEETYQTLFAQQYNAELDRIKDKEQALDDMDVAAQIIKSWIGAIPGIGGIIVAVLDTVYLPTKNMIEGWYSDEKQANLQTTHSKYTELEEFPEENPRGNPENDDQELNYNQLPR